MRTGRCFASCVAVVLAGFLSGCTDNNPAAAVSPSPGEVVTTTETFTGTLTAHSSSWNTFTAAAAGTMTLTVTSITPAVIVGVGVGTVPTGGCSVQAWNNAATATTTLTAGINPGAYCVAVYDVGNVIDPVSYELTVVHP